MFKCKCESDFNPMCVLLILKFFELDFLGCFFLLNILVFSTDCCLVPVSNNSDDFAVGMPEP